MKNKIFNTVVIILSACIFLSFFIFSNGLTSLSKVLRTLNFSWLLLAVLCIIIFWFLETAILYIITLSIYKTHHLFLKSIKFAMVGQFFSAITPFQSGGQPAQLYSMVENNIPAGPSGSVLMIKFIIHQTTLTFYSLLVLIFKFSYFNSKIPFFLYFCVLGFFINTLLILFALFFSINDKATKKILWNILKLLHKFKMVKNYENSYGELSVELMSFHDNAAIIGKKIGMCIFASVLTFMQWTSFYAIPYCIYRSFGFNSANLATMIGAQVFLVMFMSSIPLPGAAGGAEGGFYLIYGIFFKSDTIIPAIFLWRIITYYSCIGVGSIFTVLLPNTKLKKVKS